MRAAWVAATLIPVWPYLRGQLPVGHNVEFHPLRALAVADIWRAGQIVPRWVPAFAQGFGYPFFVYYGWGAYAVPGLLVCCGLEPDTAVCIAYICCALLLGSGAWLLGRELGGRNGAIVCWSLYAFAPYQFVNLLVRTNLPEYQAGAIAPWLMLGVLMLTKPVDGTRFRFTAFLCTALSSAALIFTHNVGALEFLTLAVLLAAFQLLQSNDGRLRRAGLITFALAVGAALSASFWVPLIALRNEVDLSRLYASGFRFDEHFASFSQLFSPGWGFGYSEPGGVGGMSFQVGLVPLFAICASILAVNHQNRNGADNPKFVFALSATALFAMFLMTRSSHPIWRAVLPLRLLQFPWRLLMPISLLIAMATAIALSKVRAAWRNFELPHLIAGGAILAILPYAHPQSWAGNLNTALLRRIENHAYVTTAIVDEYRPIHARNFEGPASFRVRDVLLRSSGDPIAGAELPPYEQRLRMHFKSQGLADSCVVLPVFYFPGWTLSCDSTIVPCLPDPNSGLVTASLPENRGCVFSWKPTRLQWVCDAISVGTMLLLLAAILLGSKFCRRSNVPLALPGNH